MRLERLRKIKQHTHKHKGKQSSPISTFHPSSSEVGVYLVVEKVWELIGGYLNSPTRDFLKKTERKS
jgi:hypothetical protein